MNRKMIARTFASEGPKDPYSNRALETESYGRDFPGSKSNAVPGISIPHHDTALLEYDGAGNVTRIDYYVDGTDGLLVSTILLEYTDGNLTKVNRINPDDPSATP